MVFNKKIILLIAVLLVLILSNYVSAFDMQGNKVSLYAEFMDECYPESDPFPDPIDYDFYDFDIFHSIHKDTDAENIYTFIYSNGLNPPIKFVEDDESNFVVFKIKNVNDINIDNDYVNNVDDFNYGNYGCDALNGKAKYWCVGLKETYYSAVCSDQFNYFMSPFFDLDYIINKEPVFDHDTSGSYNSHLFTDIGIDEPGFYLIIEACENHQGNYYCDMKLEPGTVDEYFWFVGTDPADFVPAEIVDEIIEYYDSNFVLLGNYELDIVADDYQEVCQYLYSDDAWVINDLGEGTCCNQFGISTFVNEFGDFVYCDELEHAWTVASSECQAKVGTENCWESSIAINDLEDTFDGSDGCCGDDLPFLELVYSCQGAYISCGDFTNSDGCDGADNCVWKLDDNTHQVFDSCEGGSFGCEDELLLYSNSGCSDYYPVCTWNNEKVCAGEIPCEEFDGDLVKCYHYNCEWDNFDFTCSGDSYSCSNYDNHLYCGQWIRYCSWESGYCSGPELSDCSLFSESSCIANSDFCTPTYNEIDIYTCKNGGSPHPSASDYNALEDCEDQGYSWASSLAYGSDFNDLYYVDDLNQFVCSIDLADTMNLIDPDNLFEDYELIETPSILGIEDMEVYNDKLYFNSGHTASGGWDAHHLSTYNYNTEEFAIIIEEFDEPLTAMEVYENKLFLGFALGSNYGEIKYITAEDNTPVHITDWNYNGASVVSMTVYGGKLFVGHFNCSIHSYDGTSWEEHNFVEYCSYGNCPVLSMHTYNDKLYVFTNSRIWEFDGVDWTEIAVGGAYDMAVFGDKLYIGSSGGIKYYDRFQLTEPIDVGSVYALEVYNNELFMLIEGGSFSNPILLLKAMSDTGVIRNVLELEGYSSEYESDLIVYNDELFISESTINQDNNHPLIKYYSAFEDILANAEWNWLDAWEESYVIHNLQLNESNYQIASNADDWFVCNADGVDDGTVDPNGATILGWEKDTIEPTKDSILGNFQVLPAEGSKEGQCPVGYWFCGCINKTLAAENDPDALPDGCVHSEIRGYLTDETVPFFHPNNKQCVASPYLCNADFDHEKYFYDDEDETSTCIDEPDPYNDNFCTDGDELDLGYDYLDNTSCPLEGECDGWVDIWSLDYGFDPVSLDLVGFMSKELCTNEFIGNCLDLGVGVDSEVCDNTEDDDNDGYVDCEDADCYNDEVNCPEYQTMEIETNCTDHIDNDNDCPGDTNLNDEECGYGDIGVDCYDPDCDSHSTCTIPSYPGVTLFAAPKNESVICHERSGNSLFTECCDNLGLSCNNAEYNNWNYFTLSPSFDVDYVSSFVGRGVPLYIINSFDEYNVEDGYIDRVKRLYSTNKVDTPIKLRFDSSSSKRNLDLSNITYDYYNTIEFDIAFTELSNIEIVYNYFNQFSEEDFILIDYTNMHLYSTNGIQPFRWHHIVIPITDNMIKFEDIIFEVDNAGMLIDNVYFGVESEDEIYQNYKCAGVFGFWIDEMDPDETSNSLTCNDVSGDDCSACDRVDDDLTDCNMGGLIENNIVNTNNVGWYDFDPFKYVCDSYLSYGWSGTKCCGDDTDRLNKEFYWDYRGGCWSGYLIRNNQRVGDAMYFDDNLNSMNKFMFYNEYFVCDPNSTEELDNLENAINDFTIDHNYVINDDNKMFLGLNELDTITLKGEGFDVTSKGICEIVHHDSKYYCQGNGLWMSSVPGIPEEEWNASIPLILKPNSTGQLSGCCPVDYCWTGDECVHATVYEYDSNKEAFNKTFDGPEHVPFDEIDNSTGKRCVFDDTGNAIWEEAQPKYDWELNKVGYCKHSDYCFVNEGFYDSYGERVNQYDQGIVIHGDGCCDINPDTSEHFTGEIIDENGEDDIPVENADCLLIDNEYYNVSDFNCNLSDCVPSGVSVTLDTLDPELYTIDNYGKYYCDEGNWTTKLSKLADKMCDLFGCDTEEFSITCDKELILNYGEEFVFDDGAIDLLGACVYKKITNQDEKVAVGYALGTELQEGGEGVSLLLTQLLSAYTAYGYENAFVECDTTTGNLEECSRSNDLVEMFYYDNELNVLLVTDIPEQDINFDPLNPTSQIIDQIVNFIYTIFYPNFNSDFFVLKGNTAYEKVFMSHNGNLQIKAAQEEKYDEGISNENKVIERISIDYSGSFNFEDILTEDYKVALFEKDVIKSRNLSKEFMFNRCQDNGVLIVKKPQVKLRNIDDDTFNKEDMLWTYLTKTLRLTGYSKEDIIIGELCTYCVNTDDCNDGMVCDNQLDKCVGDLGYEGCNFDDECSLDLECIDNVCSDPENPNQGDDSQQEGDQVGEPMIPCIGDNCENFGMTCVYNNCYNFRTIGETCDDNLDCLPDDIVCINGFCNVQSDLGETCDETGDCITGFECDNSNTCRALPGSICENNDDCATDDEGTAYTCIGHRCTYLGDVDWYCGKLSDGNLDDEDCQQSFVCDNFLSGLGPLCNYDPDHCGNSICEFEIYGEDLHNCPEDCVGCGDGVCDANEDVNNCPQDCNVCGDNICYGNEDCNDCVVDCGACCGNGVCENNFAEDFITCPNDCVPVELISDGGFESGSLANWASAWHDPADDRIVEVTDSDFASGDYSLRLYRGPSDQQYQKWVRAKLDSPGFNAQYGLHYNFSFKYKYTIQESGDEGDDEWVPPRLNFGIVSDDYDTRHLLYTQYIYDTNDEWETISFVREASGNSMSYYGNMVIYFKLQQFPVGGGEGEIFIDDVSVIN